MATQFASQRSWLPRWFVSEHPLPWLLPASALMVVFGVYPLYKAIESSLYKKNAATRRLVFDPAYNWTKVFADERVWNALLNTLVYTSVAIVLQLVLGMLIALLLDSDRKGYGILRAMMTLPLVIPPAVTAMMFLMMLNGSFGVITQGIIGLGLVAARLFGAWTIIDRDGGCLARRGLAMDAVHGAHHACRITIIAEGAV